MVANTDPLEPPAAVLVTHRLRTVVAGVVVATAAVVGAALVDLTRSSAALFFPFANGLLVVLWALAGFVLAGQPGRRRIALLVGASAWWAAVGVLCRSVSAADRHGALAEFVRFGPGADVLAAAMLFHAGMSLPNGDLGPFGRRAIVAGGYVVAFALGIAIVGHDPGSLWGERFVPVAAAVLGGGVALWYARSRYVSATIVDRRRLQWFGCAVGTAALVATIVVSANQLLSWPRPIAACLVLASMLLPLALATDSSSLAVSRAERWVIVSLQSLIWVALAAATFILFVLGLTHRPTGSEREVLVATLAAVGVLVVAAPAMRPRLAEYAAQLVHGDRLPADQVLQVLVERRYRNIPLEDLLHDTVDALAASQGTAGAELWLATADAELCKRISVPDAPTQSIEFGPGTRDALMGRGFAGLEATRLWLPDLVLDATMNRFLAAPVTQAGELLGLVVVRRSPSADEFSEADQGIVTEAARQLGLVLHNAQLDTTLAATLTELSDQAEELRASRTRLVAVADAERRRIERDLHDGAQQQLVAMAVSLGLVRELVVTDPTEAVEVLDELRVELQTAIDGLRALAHGIYPPLLAARGLGEALRASLSRGRAQTVVTVRAEDVGRYTAVMEAAVYYCCLEAVQNARKHAPSSTVSVALQQADGVLHFEIADDGPGFDPSTQHVGQGQINMRDRLGAIGGHLEWRTAPGDGTTVIGSIPI